MSDRGRAMIYPYTLTAKFVQFPYKYYVKNNWLWKYYIFGCLVTVPIFMKISKLSNSPENIRKYEETKRKELEGHH